MKALTTLTDPVYTEPKEFSRYDKFWLKYINDKRDLPFIHLLTAIHILVIPVAILLYTPLLQGWYWWLAYIPYFYISQMYFRPLWVDVALHQSPQAFQKRLYLAIPLYYLVCMPVLRPYTGNLFCSPHGYAPCRK